jgi:predicted ATPase
VKWSVPYLSRIYVVPERIRSREYPFHLPRIRTLDLKFDSPVTFFVGENGSGKSTVLEAIAVLCRLPLTGGGRSDLANADSARTTSVLASALRPVFRKRPPDAYFLRAEFQAQFASLLDSRNADPDFTMWGDPYQFYGGRSLHARSHGEALLSILQNRIRSGLFLFDEPESALSPQRQLSLLSHMSELVRAGGSQFVVATHSPILLTFPAARILSFDHDAVNTVQLEETSQYQITRSILQNPARYWRHLDADPDQSVTGLSVGNARPRQKSQRVD